MQRDYESLLWAVQHAGRTILESTAGKGAADYAADPALRSACEAQLQVVAEALTALRANYPEQAQEISETHAILHFPSGASRDDHPANPQKVWEFIEGPLLILVAEVTVSLDEWHG